MPVDRDGAGSRGHHAFHSTEAAAHPKALHRCIGCDARLRVSFPSMTLALLGTERRGWASGKAVRAPNESESFCGLNGERKGPVPARTDFGKHYLVDLSQCDPEKISRVDGVRRIFLQAAQESKASIVGEVFHQFEPAGVSGVLLIEESHFSVHTWPEDSFVGVDIFTCGEEMEAPIAIDSLQRGFGAQEVEVKVVVRGRLGQDP